MKQKQLFAAVCLMSAPMLAVSDNYVRLGVGMLDYDDQSFTIISENNNDRVDLKFSDYDPGTAPFLSLEVGRYLASHWRAGLSLESTIASSESDSVSVTNNGEPAAVNFSWKQKIDTDMIMANGYYHLWSDRGQGDFDPFLVGSLGIALHDISDVTLVNDDDGVESILSEGDSAQLAFRVGAGAAYWITDSIQVDARVSYLDAGSVRFGQVGGTGPDDDFNIEEFAQGVEADIKAYELQVGVSAMF